MYSILLALHSAIRWFLLIGIVFALYRAYTGWLSNKPFSSLDDKARLWTVIIVHTQLVLGSILYFISPIVDYFLHNVKEAMHERELRFFGMEHSFMMLTGIIVITIGSAKAKRKQTDKDKYKTLAIWFTIGLLIILSSIPWAFSPLVSRPYVRGF